ncbi:MAG TPA: DUF4956 domain-containing protein [Anaerolineae bacterium]|nr:DUF4956 domain-containing protein [Anaerolineae bacterium]HQI83199.1 DUF4956 domain-containing protein [Anaerolineae bacterium]
MDDFVTFGFSFLLNGVVALLMIRYIYYPVKRDKDYVLTFLVFNTLAFLIASLLNGVDLKAGFGLGLFAIFSILRYRTDPIPVREMTYLFVMIGLAVVNAVLVTQGSYASMFIANIAVMLALFLVEREWGFHYVSQKSITYERIDLIKPENYQLLLADLRARTGLDITRCEIGKLDFLRDVVEIKIYYAEPQEQVVLVQSAPDTPDYSGLFGQELQIAPAGQPAPKRQVEKRSAL